MILTDDAQNRDVSAKVPSITTYRWSRGAGHQAINGIRAEEQTPKNAW